MVRFGETSQEPYLEHFDSLPLRQQLFSDRTAVLRQFAWLCNLDGMMIHCWCTTFKFEELRKPNEVIFAHVGFA